MENWRNAKISLNCAGKWVSVRVFKKDNTNVKTNVINIEVYFSLLEFFLWYLSGLFFCVKYIKCFWNRFWVVVCKDHSGEEWCSFLWRSVCAVSNLHTFPPTWLLLIYRWGSLQKLKWLWLVSFSLYIIFCKAVL